MRALLIAAGLLAMASSAFADTLTEVTSHGIVLSIQGMDFPITFTPDGKFTAGEDGQSTGTWRIEGDKLCTITNPNPAESCVAYPQDKKSGDVFDLTTAIGSVKIRIR